MTISSLLGLWNSLEVLQARRKRLPQRLLSHIPKGASVLDVGSGDGYIASQLLHQGQASTVQGVDVLLRPAPHIPTQKFDGEHLPFGDNAFDVVTLVDVLHHCEHPERLLAEAARVAHQRIVIKDHYWVSVFDRWILSCSDYIGNKPYGISLPYNFLRMEQWHELFESLTMPVLSHEQFHYSLCDRTKQVIFVVEPVRPKVGAMALSQESDAPPAQ